jgi:hypothetical protein
MMMEWAENIWWDLLRFQASKFLLNIMKTFENVSTHRQTENEFLIKMSVMKELGKGSLVISQKAIEIGWRKENLRMFVEKIQGI